MTIAPRHATVSATASRFGLHTMPHSHTLSHTDTSRDKLVSRRHTAVELLRRCDLARIAPKRADELVEAMSTTAPVAGDE